MCGSGSRYGSGCAGPGLGLDYLSDFIYCLYGKSEACSVQLETGFGSGSRSGSRCVGPRSGSGCVGPGLGLDYLSDFICCLYGKSEACSVQLETGFGSRSRSGSGCVGPGIGLGPVVRVRV
jgi:hypothetical protein